MLIVFNHVSMLSRSSLTVIVIIASVKVTDACMLWSTMNATSASILSWGINPGRLGGGG